MMHYHNIQDEPGGMITYCADHGEDLEAQGEILYVCDCEGKAGDCVICEEYDE